MKILNRKIGKDRSGFIHVECEEPEDFWHIYNLLRKGDIITSTTIRKIQHETNTGSVSSQKKVIRLSLQVDTIDYDTSTCVIRIKGVNVKENKYVSLGQSHTTELNLHRPFSIEKKEWDSMDLERIRIANDPTKSADLAVVVMEYGLAHVILVSDHMTLVRAKIEKTIPRKRAGSSSRHDSAIEKFYMQVLEAIIRHIDFDVIKCVVLASPAFIKDDFYEFIWKTASQLSDSNDTSDPSSKKKKGASGKAAGSSSSDDKNAPYKVLLSNKSKFIKGHCSSGHKGAVKEILQDKEMQKQLSDTKASGEVKLLDEFFKLLNDDETRAMYGFRHVKKANESKAVQTLLVTDKLFRSADLTTRKQYVALVDSARRNGADIRIFSSLHVSGEQLDQITGVAAFLRFPMPELLEMEDEGEEEQIERTENRKDEEEKKESVNEASDATDDEDAEYSQSDT